MRSIQDDEFSKSINYFLSLSNTVSLKVRGTGTESLNECGRDWYNYYHDNFGLICGDHYVTAYKQGAMLIISFYIIFNSENETERMRDVAMDNFCGLEQVLSRINKICREKNISASVTVRAFQIGGEITELAEILPQSDSKCDVKYVEMCNTTALSLLAYVLSFGNQLKDYEHFERISVIEYKSIESLNLTAPDSLVTQEVEKYRKELADKLVRNKYFLNKLQSSLEPKTPHQSQVKNDFFKNTTIILEKAKTSVDLLLNKDTGASACFDQPYKCKEIKDRIEANLQDIWNEEIRSLFS